MAEGNSASARRRKRRKAAQGGSVWKSLLAAAARLPWRAGRAGFAFASAHKRGTALVACGIAFAAATNAG